jgi:hypothetical protein
MVVMTYESELKDVVAPLAVASALVGVETVPFDDMVKVCVTSSLTLAHCHPPKPWDYSHHFTEAFPS